MLNFSKAATISFMIFGGILSYAQNTGHIDYYNSFDKNIGIENTGLYQGVIYTEKYRTINKNSQFFKTWEFQKGNVCYDGECYYGLDLKYDVYEDEVLIKLITKVGGGTLKLIKDYVESFQIGGHNFIKISPIDAPSLSIYGFYEVVYKSSELSLFIRHIKNSFDRKDRKTVYYEFLKGKSKNVLFYRGVYSPINTKKDIVVLFPDLKKEIDKFYNMARGLRKSDPNHFYISLIKRIENVLPQKANQSEE